MKCAVVDKSGAVVNVIVADPERDELPGHTLVAVPDGVPVDPRWVWSESDGFKPGPEIQAEIDARALEIEAIAYDMGD